MTDAGGSESGSGIEGAAKGKGEGGGAGRAVWRTIMFGSCLSVAVADAPKRTGGESADSGESEVRVKSEEKRPVVTILMRDGQVLEFPRRLKCADLLVRYPHHAVCQASALVMRQKGKVLRGDAYLERGGLYFLIPKPARRAKKTDLSEDSSEPDAAPAATDGSGSSQGPVPSLKFVISKQYLAQIVAEAKSGSVLLHSPSRRSSEAAPAKPHVYKPRPKPVVVKRARSVRNQWSGPLDTIVEAT